MIKSKRGLKKILFLKVALLLQVLALAQQPIHIDSVKKLAAQYYYTQPDSAQYVLHKGIKLAEQIGDNYRKGQFLYKLISQKTRIKDWDSARYYFRFAKAFLEKHKLTTLYPDVNSEMAEAYYYMEKLDSALYHFGVADSLYAKDNDSLGVLISKNNKANVYQIQGKYDEAITNLLDAARNVDTTQYLYIKAELYQNVSALYHQVGEDSLSFEFAKKALKLALANTDYPQDIVLAYVLMAHRYIERSDINAAENAINKAAYWIDKEHLTSLSHVIAGAKGNLLVAKRSFDKAKPFLENAISQSEERGLNEFELFSLRKNLALTYRELKEYDKAEELLGSMLIAAKEANRLDDQMDIYQELALNQEANGNPKGALQNIRAYQQLNDSIFGAEKQEIIKDALIKYQTLEKEKELLATQAVLEKSERQKLMLYGGLAITILIAFLVYLFYNQQRLRNRQLKKEVELKEALSRIEIQNQLQEQRLRISRDLHDNIGSQLTFVTSSLDNLKFRIGDSATLVSTKLTSISDFTTQTIYELRDTIWAMNKESISLEDLKTRISNFIQLAGKAMEGVRFAFHADENDTGFEMPSLYGMNVYRIIQEGVNNALKHSQAQHIDVYLNHEDALITLKVIDDGKGFELKDDAHVNGLNIIQKRAKDIGGEALIHSEIGKGTEIRVKAPSPK